MTTYQSVGQMYGMGGNSDLSGSFIHKARFCRPGAGNEA